MEPTDARQSHYRVIDIPPTMPPAEAEALLCATVDEGLYLERSTTHGEGVLRLVYKRRVRSSALERKPA